MLEILVDLLDGLAHARIWHPSILRDLPHDPPATQEEAEGLLRALPLRLGRLSRRLERSAHEVEYGESRVILSFEVVGTTEWAVLDHLLEQVRIHGSDSYDLDAAVPCAEFERHGMHEVMWGRPDSSILMVCRGATEPLKRSGLRALRGAHRRAMHSKS